MSSEEHPDRHKRFLLADLPAGAALFLLVLALFSSSLPFAFLNWRDQDYILQNPWIMNFSPGGIAALFSHHHFMGYQPLTMLSYMVDFFFVGYEPWGYRLHNIILHGVCTVLFFMILRSFRVGTLLAVVVAGFFALHPLRIEAVVWISGRNQLLCAAFFLLSFFLWRVASSIQGNRQWFLLPIVVITCLLSLFSWALAAVLPIVLLLHDILLCRDRLKGRIVVHGILFVLGAVFAWIYMTSPTTPVVADTPWGDRVNNAVWSPLHYLITTLAPARLSPIYPYEGRPIEGAEFAIQGWLLCLVALALAVAWWRRNPVYSFGILAGAVILAPLSGLIPLERVYAADRLSYLPSIFLLVTVGVVIEDLFRRLPGWFARAILPASVPLVAYYAGVSLWVMPDWRNSEYLWNRALDIYPGEQTAIHNLNHARATGARNKPSLSLDPSYWENPDRPRPIDVYKLIQAENISEAIEVASRLPVRNDTLLWTLKATRSVGDWSGGGGAAGEVLAAEDAPAELRAEAIRNLYMRGHHGEAVEYLLDLREPTFQGAATWAIIAADRLAGDVPGDPLAAAERALAINPAQRGALDTLMDHHRRNDTLPQALPHVIRAARHSGGSPGTRIYGRVMEAYIREQMGENSERQYTRAFSRAINWRGSTAARLELLDFAASLAEEVGRNDDAIRILEEAIDLQDNNDTLLLRLEALRERN
ncbi:MAG: hypothetical protein JJU11_06525 [Candidatus Sumerlaeia bacterium]|nr:hypothetical protein [Candidatus Sumerlaeia bacterium]